MSSLLKKSASQCSFSGYFPKKRKERQGGRAVPCEHAHQYAEGCRSRLGHSGALQLALRPADHAGPLVHALQTEFYPHTETSCQSTFIILIRNLWPRVPGNPAAAGKYGPRLGVVCRQGGTGFHTLTVPGCSRVACVHPPGSALNMQWGNQKKVLPDSLCTSVHATRGRLS